MSTRDVEEPKMNRLIVDVLVQAKNLHFLLRYQKDELELPRLLVYEINGMVTGDVDLI